MGVLSWLRGWMSKPKAVTELFEGRYFDREVITPCARWHLRFQLSPRPGGDDGRALLVGGACGIELPHCIWDAWAFRATLRPRSGVPCSELELSIAASEALFARDGYLHQSHIRFLPTSRSASPGL